MRFYFVVGLVTFVVGLVTAVIWVSATVCAILAGVQGTTHAFVAWALIAVTAFVSCRLAGSKLKEKLDQRDKQEKEARKDVP